MTKDQRFKELSSDLTRKIDFKKYPDTIFFFKEDKYMFEYNIISGYLWCDYNHVWSVFEDEFQMKYNEVQSFIKDQVEQHFKLRSVTPNFDPFYDVRMVEQHFKLRSVTPHKILFSCDKEVEQHFKLRSVTPRSRVVSP